jgi:hypothetical protein
MSLHVEYAPPPSIASQRCLEAFDARGLASAQAASASQHDDDSLPGAISQPRRPTLPVGWRQASQVRVASTNEFCSCSHAQAKRAQGATRSVPFQRLNGRNACYCVRLASFLGLTRKAYTYICCMLKPLLVSPRQSSKWSMSSSTCCGISTADQTFVLAGMNFSDIASTPPDSTAHPFSPGSHNHEFRK